MDIVSIIDFGAIGDGIHDDTDSIQQAITSGASTVLIPKPKKWYNISKGIQLTSNLHILGRGNPTIKLVDNATNIPYGLIIAEGVKKYEIIIEGIKVDRNRTNNIDHGDPDSKGNQSPYYSGKLLALLNLTNVNGIMVKDCQFINSWGSAAWISACKDITIQNCTAYDYRITGLAVRNNIQIANNPSNILISGNRCAGGAIGMDIIFGAENISIVNNICYNNKDSNRFILGYNGSYPDTIYPSDTRFKTPSEDGYNSPAFKGDGAGIDLTGKYTDDNAIVNRNVSVTSNICYENEVGIRTEEDTQFIIIVGNSCERNDKHGIFVFSSRFCTISSNQCNYNGDHGICIEKLNLPNRDTARPEVNTCIGNVCLGNGHFGIMLVGAWQTSVVGNNCSGNNINLLNNGGGIGLYNSGNFVVSNCSFVGNILVSYNLNDKYGIYSNSNFNDNNIITNNIFWNHSIKSIEVNSNNNIITNNIIH